jgi:hypothetical protein
MVNKRGGSSYKKMKKGTNVERELIFAYDREECYYGLVKKRFGQGFEVLINNETHNVMLRGKMFKRTYIYPNDVVLVEKYLNKYIIVHKYLSHEVETLKAHKEIQFEKHSDTLFQENDGGSESDENVFEFDDAEKNISKNNITQMEESSSGGSEEESSEGSEGEEPKEEQKESFEKQKESEEESSEKQKESEEESSEKQKDSKEGKNDKENSETKKKNDAKMMDKYKNKKNANKIVSGRNRNTARDKKQSKMI